MTVAVNHTGTIWRFFPVIRIIKFPEGIRGNLDAPVKKKKGFFARFKKSAEEAQAAQNETKKSKKNKKK